ncbi:hypothetical protein WJX74_003908 [Apatococcus lobatus]|uniref:Mediator of RNA polymerase II transcription subunit 20 n=1 Tax=Apatococcus lobatus TaxID=904363 RepID=A0AAW1S2A0_9CHLO
MTISCILVWRQQPDGPQNRQATEALVAALEGLRASARRGWAVQISAQQPLVEGGQRGSGKKGAADVYITSISELKDSTFLVARQQRQVLEAENGIVEILRKTSSYKDNFLFKFEGTMSVMGDFSIKLGRGLLKGFELKGLVVEVLYRPTTDIKAGRPILEAFIQILQERTHATLPGLREVVCPWVEYSLGNIFTPAHSAVHFAASLGPPDLMPGMYPSFKTRWPVTKLMACSQTGFVCPDTVVVVTGASRGLGLEFVKQLLKTSQSRVVATARNPTGSKGLSALVEQFADRLNLITLDTSSDSSIEQAAAAVAKLHGGIDILINNAGIDEGIHPCTDLSGQEYRDILNVNVVGTFLVTKTFLPLLKKKESRTIVNISSSLGSVSGNRSLPDTMPLLAKSLMAYNSSKSALNMQTSGWANELRDDKFSILAINPGFVQTDMGGKNAADLGMGQAPLKPEDSIAAVLRVVRSMSPDKSGQFLSHEGEPIPD